MSSLYLHIPFCKQACYYCDFHFSTNLSLKTDLINALCQEIALQKDYLTHKNLETIYFGGGTPSLLSQQDLEQIFQTINQNFHIKKEAEITLEANPDDLDKEKLEVLKQIGFNRLSIGAQSFEDKHLTYLNRVHNASESESVIKLAQDSGFENLTIDLIYAIPAQNHNIWQSDLEKALNLNVSHVSAYCLTIEEKTVFGNWLKNQKIPPIDDDFAGQQFEILMNTLSQNNFEHYEISNFAKNQLYSKHNSNYWMKNTYLGIGPSAHSYDGFSRQFNISNNTKYIKDIQERKIPFEKEILTKKQQVNEYLMTGLRTQWGCDLEKIKLDFEINLLEVYKDYLIQLQIEKLILIDKNHLKLTQKGKFLADKIAGDLFLD